MGSTAEDNIFCNLFLNTLKHKIKNRGSNVIPKILSCIPNKSKYKITKN